MAREEAGARERGDVSAPRGRDDHQGTYSEKYRV